MALTIGELKAWLAELPEEMEEVEIACQTGESWPRELKNVSYHNGPAFYIHLGGWSGPLTPRILAGMNPVPRSHVQKLIDSGVYPFEEIDRPDKPRAPHGHYSMNPPIHFRPEEEPPD
jgi:hypothetical protein